MLYIISTKWIWGRGDLVREGAGNLYTALVFIHPYLSVAEVPDNRPENLIITSPTPYLIAPSNLNSLLDLWNRGELCT